MNHWSKKYSINESILKDGLSMIRLRRAISSMAISTVVSTVTCKIIESVRKGA